MRRFLVRLVAGSGHPVQCTIGDLDWWRNQGDYPDQEIASARLWFAPSGDLAGFAWPDDDEVDVFARPTHKVVEDTMFA